MSRKKINTFGGYEFPAWVNVSVAQQIISFWGCFNRDYHEWLDNSKPYEKEGSLPKMGEDVIFFRHDRDGLYQKIEGKYIHAWNNMGRIMKEDMTHDYVSSCDNWMLARRKNDA